MPASPRPLAPLALWAALGAPACGVAAPAPPAIPAGGWAGPAAAMQVDESGAHVRFRCAAAEVAGPLALDEEGRFDLPARYERRAGPEPYRQVPARVRGRVQGHRMTLELSLEGEQVVQGPLELELGAEPPELGLCR